MRITGGLLKNRSLKTPKGAKTRPTSEKLRQSVFNIVQAYIDNCVFLDLFAGSGAMGIEALSRGAKEATFIENDRSALKTLKENLNTLDLSSFSTLLTGDVLTVLKKLKGKTFDLIYVDPPYEKGLQEKTLVLIDQLDLLPIGGLLFLEESAKKELEFPPLKTLELKKKRKMGNTFLYEFQTNPAAVLK